MSAEIKRSDNLLVGLLHRKTQKIVHHYKNLTILLREGLCIFLDIRFKSVSPKRLYLFLFPATRDPLSHSYFTTKNGRWIKVAIKRAVFTRIMN